MKKTLLFCLLCMAAGISMAQTQPAGGSQIKVKTIKAPRPELPDRGAEGTGTPPVKTTKPTKPALPVKSASATENKTKEVPSKKKLSENFSSERE